MCRELELPTPLLIRGHHVVSGGSAHTRGGESLAGAKRAGALRSGGRALQSSHLQLIQSHYGAPGSGQRR